MKKKIIKTTLILFSVIINILAGVVIFYFWKPFANWYFNYRPILGIDFYNLTSYVAFLSKHFVLQVNGWRNTSFAGGPLSFDYPILHAYLILPLLNYFSLVESIQVYVLVSIFLFFFFSYLLFTVLGKDKILSLILTIGLTLSSGLYGSIVWGGALQYSSTQFFLPLVLLLLFKYFFTSNIKWYYLSALFAGLSFLGHPQVGFIYLIPITEILLIAYPLENIKFLSLARIKKVLLYFLIVFIIGFPQLGAYVGYYPPGVIINTFGYIKGFSAVFIPNRNITEETKPVLEAQTSSSTTGADIAQFNKNQLKQFVNDTSKILWNLLPVALIVIVLGFVIRRRKRNSLKVLIFALPLIYILFFNSLLAFGIGFFQGGWYRAFWAFPLSLGILISFAWGDFLRSIYERFTIFDRKILYKGLLLLASAVFFLAVGYMLLPLENIQKMITKLEIPKLRQQSSAFPDSLNIFVKKNEAEDLKNRLIPSWLNPNDWQYRLYEADQRVNIWWNALFDMPLVKGYIDIPPGDSATGSFYWTSIALTATEGKTDSLVKTWNTPEVIAYNNALFLIDWFSIKYLEAEHEKSDSYNPFTTYLAKSDIFSNKQRVDIPGWAQLYAIPDGKPLIWHPEIPEYLTFYQVKDKYISPIIHPTNASVVGMIGPLDAYNTIFRDLGTLNLNSKQIISVRLGKYIDDVSEEDLKSMDALILYGYDYKNHNKSWSKIEGYVKKGGKVWIETGNDVKESNSTGLVSLPKDLPELFPINQTKRSKLGRWNLSSKNVPQTKDVDLKLFGPPLLDNEEWNFSIPSDGGTKSGSKVILSTNDIPLIVSREYGGGLVIWSGLNLPYHLSIYKTIDEANLFKNIIGTLVPYSNEDYPEFKAGRPSPNKVVVESSGSKGVIFRENNNPGWRAYLNSDKVSKQIKIYPTGPTYYGFSYVRIPEEARKSFKVTYSYQGEFWGYFWQTLSLFTILVILDKVFLRGKVLSPILSKTFRRLKNKVNSWWDKSEEE